MGLALTGWNTQENFSPNVVGGSSLNIVSNGAFSATIAGGGGTVSIFGSTIFYPNLVNGSFGTIGRRRR